MTWCASAAWAVILLVWPGVHPEKPGPPAHQVVTLGRFDPRAGTYSDFGGGDPGATDEGPQVHNPPNYPAIPLHRGSGSEAASLSGRPDDPDDDDDHDPEEDHDDEDHPVVGCCSCGENSTADGPPRGADDHPVGVEGCCPCQGPAEPEVPAAPGSGARTSLTLLATAATGLQGPPPHHPTTPRTTPPLAAAPADDVSQFAQRLERIFDLDTRFLGQLADLLDSINEDVMPQLSRAVGPLIRTQTLNTLKLGELLGYFSQAVQGTSFTLGAHTSLGQLGFVNAGPLELSLSDSLDDRTLHLLATEAVKVFASLGFPLGHLVQGRSLYDLWGKGGRNLSVPRVLVRRLVDNLKGSQTRVSLSDGEARLTAESPPLTLVEGCEATIRMGSSTIRGTLARYSQLKVSTVANPGPLLGEVKVEGDVEFGATMDSTTFARIGTKILNRCIAKLEQSLPIRVHLRGWATVGAVLTVAESKVIRLKPRSGSSEDAPPRDAGDNVYRYPVPDPPPRDFEASPKDPRDHRPEDLGPVVRRNSSWGGELLVPDGSPAMTIQSMMFHRRRKNWGLEVSDNDPRSSSLPPWPAISSLRFRSEPAFWSMWLHSGARRKSDLDLSGGDTTGSARSRLERLITRKRPRQKKRSKRSQRPLMDNHVDTLEEFLKDKLRFLVRKLDLGPQVRKESGGSTTGEEEEDTFRPYLSLKVIPRLQVSLTSLVVDRVEVANCDLSILGLNLFSYCGFIGDEVKRVIPVFARRFVAMGLPKVLRQVEQMLQDMLGDPVLIPLRPVDKKAALLKTLSLKVDELNQLKADLALDLGKVTSALFPQETELEIHNILSNLQLGSQVLDDLTSTVLNPDDGNL